MDYKIVIPSYKRPFTLLEKTLKVLNSYKIDMRKRVYIFVANKEEFNIYAEIIPRDFYYKIVIGKKGMKNIRNFITNYFPEKELLFHMDDDIQQILTIRYSQSETYLSGKSKARLVRLPDLKGFIKEGFSICKKLGYSLFGIYPIRNAYFMRREITFDLKYIIGSMWGCINNHKIKVTTDDKEDFERTILFYLKDNGVVRFNDITVRTRYYLEPGGMQEDRTAETIHESALKLNKKYPMLAHLNLKRKYTEIRLRDKRDNKPETRKPIKN